MMINGREWNLELIDSIFLGNIARTNVVIKILEEQEHKALFQAPLRQGNFL